MFEGEHRQHRGVTGRADRHGVLCRKRRRNLDQPFAFHPCLLRISAVMGLTQSPAVGDDAVSDCDAGIGGCLHCSSEIDTGNEGKLANDLRAPANGQRVLVVHGRIVDRDRDIARHQIGVVEVGHLRRERSILSRGYKCFESHCAILFWAAHHRALRMQKALVGLRLWGSRSSAGPNPTLHLSPPSFRPGRGTGWCVLRTTRDTGTAIRARNRDRRSAAHSGCAAAGGRN